MLVKELIEKLSKFDGNLEIKINHCYTEHYCGEGPCYCSMEDHILTLCDPVLVKDMNIYHYNDVGKSKKPIGKPAIIMNIDY